MTAVLIVALGAPLFAQAPKPASADDHRALLIEYLVTREKSWRARQSAKSWRTEVTRYDGDVPVKAITETQCPDAFHLHTVRGNSIKDFYSIAGVEYRQVNGKWVTRHAAKGFFYCPTEQETRRLRANDRPPEEAVMNYLDQFLGMIEVEKGPVRTVHGEKCQEWKEYWPGNPAENRPPSRPTAVCYSLADSHLVESDGMSGPSPHPTITINYDWNKPIAIKPPFP